MKGKRNAAISHEEVQQALRKFQQNGGLITRLPDQAIVGGRQVGSRYGIYEQVLDGFATFEVGGAQGNAGA